MARINTSNFFETKLTAEMSATDLTAQVESTTGAPTSPLLLTIEPDVLARREVILVDGSVGLTSFTTSVIGNRYLDGSAAGSGLVHPIDSVVRGAVLAQQVNGLWDDVEAAQDDIDTHQAAADPHTQYVAVAGDTMTGSLEVGGSVTSRNDAASPVVAAARSVSGTIWDFLMSVFASPTRAVLRYREGGVTRWSMKIEGSIADVDAGAFRVGGADVARTVTGSYTGDGAASRIIPVGFEFKELTIISYAHQMWKVVRVGTTNATFYSASGYAESGGSGFSVTSSGFNVGMSESWVFQSPNASGDAYRWSATG